jgi:hypothetical protein
VLDTIDYPLVRYHLLSTGRTSGRGGIRGG